MQETLSPPEYARRLGVKHERVLGWIKRGELAAINVSDSGRRPLWRIRLEDVADFERRRSSQPPAPKPTKRHKGRLRPGVKEHF